MAGYALPAEIEERQVVRSCLNGENDGFDQFYRRYAPALVAFCERRLGTVGDAEDAAHEAILKAHRALPRFREGARLWPWLATIAANVCTDIQRSRERLESGDATSDEGLAARLFAPEVDEDVSRRLRASIVDAALDELPERFRTPLFLREFMGWSYEEIAAFSNKSIGSVRTTLMRSRRAFQSRVEDVARRRGQWPLPAVVVGGWRRLRSSLRNWRDSLARAGGDAANVVWRAEGLLGGLGSGLQAAAVAVVAAGALAGAAPAMAADGAGGTGAQAMTAAADLSAARDAALAAAGQSAAPQSGSPAASARGVALDATAGHEKTNELTDTAVSTQRDDNSINVDVYAGADVSGDNSSATGTEGKIPCGGPSRGWGAVCTAYDTATGVAPLKSDS